MTICAHKKSSARNQLKNNNNFPTQFSQLEIVLEAEQITINSGTEMAPSLRVKTKVRSFYTSTQWSELTMNVQAMTVTYNYVKGASCRVSHDTFVQQSFSSSCPSYIFGIFLYMRYVNLHGKFWVNYFSSSQSPNFHKLHATILLWLVAHMCIYKL